MAAYRMGITTVFIPEQNKKDLEEVDPVVKEKITFVPVRHVSEILKAVLIKPPVKPEKLLPPVTEPVIQPENGLPLRQ